MRSLCALSVCVVLLLATAAQADSRVFIVASQADGYGIDSCLASGDICGAPAARAYCESQEFAEATAFHRLGPDDVTAAVPVSTVPPATDGDYVAITCQR